MRHEPVEAGALFDSDFDDAAAEEEVPLEDEPLEDDEDAASEDFFSPARESVR